MCSLQPGGLLLAQPSAVAHPSHPSSSVVLFLDKSYFIDSNLKGLKTSKLPVLYYGDADQRFFPL